MKVFISITLALLMTITYCSCSPPPRPPEELDTFSYEEEIALYSDAATNVKRDGFVNDTELDSDLATDFDAVDQAKKEYDLSGSLASWKVFYDPDTRIWKVVFGYSYYDDTQAVYMNEKGKTLLIVYFEVDAET